LATLIWRISWRISTVTAGRPQRCFDFHRQYDLNPARCQRITVSGRTIASAPYILGNSRQTPPNINLSNRTKSKSLRISASQHIDLLPQHQNLGLKRNLRPQQVAGHPKDQSTQIQHRVPASRDSQSTASTIEFTTGTTSGVTLTFASRV
jgi:hypothetical protein